MIAEYQPSDEFLELLLGCTEGELTARQRHRLNQLLAADREAREYLVEYTSLHALLEVHQKGAPVMNLPLVEAGPLVSQPAASGTWWITVGVAASLLIALAAGVYFGGGLGTRDEVARFVEGDRIVWEDRADRQAGAAAGLAPGRGTLTAGIARIELHSGVRIALEGPSQFELLSDNSRFRLNRGKVRVRVPPAATGFTVRAPRVEVTDLGTEFGVLVAENGDVEVHVFAGKVQINRRLDLTAGQRQRINLQGELLECRLEGKAFPSLE